MLAAIGPAAWTPVGLDGQRRWRAEPGVPWGAPSVVDGIVVWTTIEAAHADDAVSVKERWQFEAASSAGSPAIADGVVYLRSIKSALRALDIETGEPVWTVETTSRPSVAPVVAGDVVYYGSDANRVYGPPHCFLRAGPWSLLGQGGG